MAWYLVSMYHIYYEVFRRTNGSICYRTALEEIILCGRQRRGYGFLRGGIAAVCPCSLHLRRYYRYLSPCDGAGVTTSWCSLTPIPNLEEKAWNLGFCPREECPPPPDNSVTMWIEERRLLRQNDKLSVSFHSVLIVCSTCTRRGGCLPRAVPWILFVHQVGVRVDVVRSFLRFFIVLRSSFVSSH